MQREPKARKRRAHSGTRIQSKQHVLNLIGVSDPTLWRMVRRGDFPKPIKMTPGRVGWLTEEIEGWIEERSAARMD